jgi:small ligand-binding sensory domain FIST
MPFSAALSTLPQTAPAVQEACARARAGLDGPPDLAVVFFSPHHADGGALISSLVYRELTPGCLLGCVGEAVLGGDEEIEEQPAVSVWLARWASDVTQEPFHLTLERTADGPSLLGAPDGLLDRSTGEAVVLLLGDPFTFPAELFLSQVNAGGKDLRVLGGMASGVRGPGEARLLLDGAVHNSGAVGVLLRGQVGLRSIVSQGCRPVGRPLLITKARENVIIELGGKDPMEQLRELWQALSPEDQKLLQHGLHIGRVINEYQDVFQRGDFLVRNVVDRDRETGGLVITDRVRVGQTVQFHVRDADTADEDLHALLQLDLSAHDKSPAAALVFSCNGRGSRLFSQPHHDARAVRAEAGPIPLAGFFAMGELGPVGGQNFVHGFTASVALFEE